MFLRLRIAALLAATLAASARAETPEFDDVDRLPIHEGRLYEVVKPDRQTAIKHAISEISGAAEVVENGRDFAPAQRTILALHRAGELNEAAVLGFAKAFKYEESVAAVAALRSMLRSKECALALLRSDPGAPSADAVNQSLDRFRATVLNTWDRTNAYLAAAKAFSGQFYEAIPGANRLSTCALSGSVTSRKLVSGSPLGIL